MIAKTITFSERIKKMAPEMRKIHQLVSRIMKDYADLKDFTKQLKLDDIYHEYMLQCIMKRDINHLESLEHIIKRISED